MTTKKMAILTITPEVLRQLLQLPECDVIRVETDPGYRGVLRLVIEGAGWDTPEGGPIMPADTAICTTETDDEGHKHVAIDWRLPANEPEEADASIQTPFIWGQPITDKTHW